MNDNDAATGRKDAPGRKPRLEMTALVVALLAFVGTILSSLVAWNSQRTTNNTQNRLAELQQEAEGRLVELQLEAENRLAELQLQAEQESERQALRAAAYQGFTRGLAEFEIKLGALQSVAAISQLGGAQNMTIDVGGLAESLYQDAFDGLSEITQSAAQLSLVASEPVANQGNRIALLYPNLLIALSSGDPFLMESFSDERCDIWQEFIADARPDLAVEAFADGLVNDIFCSPLDEALFEALAPISPDIAASLTASCAADSDVDCDVLAIMSPLGTQEWITGASCGGRRPTPEDSFCSGYAQATSTAHAYGDEPLLDALFDICEGGDKRGCLALYNYSPVASEYEAAAVDRLEAVP